MRPRRIFGIGDASPNADDAWAAHLRSSPRRKPSPRVPNRQPRFPTSSPPPGPSAHPSGFSIRSQQDTALAFGSAIPSAFRPRPSKQSFSAATSQFQPTAFMAPVRTSVATEFNSGERTYSTIKPRSPSIRKPRQIRRECELKSQMRYCNVRWTCVASGVANRDSKRLDFIGFLAQSAVRRPNTSRKGRFRAKLRHADPGPCV